MLEGTSIRVLLLLSGWFFTEELCWHVVQVLPSLSPLAAAVVSVESQLSCSVASVGPVEATAVPVAGVLPLEDGVASLPVTSVVASVSDVVFVHWRAFFCRARRAES